MRNSGTVGGNVNIPYKKVEYTGLDTDTASVVINNVDNTIAVNVNEDAIQTKLTPGENITIVDGVISSTGGISEEELQQVKTELEDEIDTKATPEDIQVAIADKVTEKDLETALETKQDKLPNLFLQFSDYYNSKYPSNNIVLDIDGKYNGDWEGKSIEDKDNFLNAFHSLIDSSYSGLICGIFMSYLPGKDHLVDVYSHDSNTLNIQIIDDTLFPTIGIFYNEKEDKFEYDLSRWIGASAEERLIVLDSANNYMVDEDNVILPPYISPETYNDRLNDIVNLMSEWNYNRTYPSVTLKIINSNTPDYSSAADKVYTAQLCMTYDENNNIYKAVLSTCDGNYEITYSNEEEAG